MIILATGKKIACKRETVDYMGGVTDSRRV